MFSPDGKWLLAVEGNVNGLGDLRRYDVQTGKMVALIKSASEFSSFGFSPDGRSLWFTGLPDGRIYSHFTFDVVRASDLKPLWSTSASGVVKWLPDGRVGIIQADSFEWRDASGRLLGHLRGPFQIFPGMPGIPQIEITDWALSPDGNWIYTCETDGTVRRWRAR